MSGDCETSSSEFRPGRWQILMQNELKWHFLKGQGTIFLNGIFSIVVTKLCLCTKSTKSQYQMADAVCSNWHFRANILALLLPIFLAALVQIGMISMPHPPTAGPCTLEVFTSVYLTQPFP
jgi:hypothetical protein